MKTHYLTRGGAMNNGRIFTKENFTRLTPLERGRLMYLHMSQGQGGRFDYLPEDCAECCACSRPMLGYGGFCDPCGDDYDALIDKALDSKRKQRGKAQS